MDKKKTNKKDGPSLVSNAINQPAAFVRHNVIKATQAPRWVTGVDAPSRR